MSTILKALRRLEEEQSQDKARSLQDQVLSGAADVPKGSSTLKVVAILATGVASAAAGGLAFALWSGSGAQSPPAVAAAPTVVEATQLERSAPASAQADARRPIAARSPESARARPARVSTAARADVMPDQRAWSDRAGDSAAGEVATRRVDSLSANGTATPQEDSEGGWQNAAPVGVEAFEAEPSPEITTPEIAPSVVARAANPGAEASPVVFAEDVAVVTQEEPPLPVIDDRNPSRIEPESPLSIQVEEPLRVIRRPKLPAVEVVQTMWHPSPSRRQAVLRVDGEDELLKLSQGDSVGALILLEIQPAGVVFAHEGLQIQRRVGDAPGFQR